MQDHTSSRIPVARCSACGGEWFREATYYAFLKENHVVVCDGSPDLVGQDSITPMTVAVCLCGMPLEPLIGGVRSGHTLNWELNQFLNALKTGRERIQQNHEGDLVVAAAEERLAKPEDLAALKERLKTLQQEIGRRQRQPSGPGRYQQLPTRQPASGTKGSIATLTRDGLALLLQERGLDFRQAREVVDAILDSMIQNLRQGGSVDVPPLGTFRVENQPPPRRRFRFGRMQTLFRQPTKVAFEPTKALSMILERKFFPEEVRDGENNDERYCCDKCGSTMFIESQFRQYRQVPSSMPGGDLSPLNCDYDIRALVCICGHPMRLMRKRRRVTGDLASFEKSFRMAVRRREAIQTIADRLSASFASRPQQMALAERISSIQAIVQAFLTSQNDITPATGNAPCVDSKQTTR
jgi:nucleoid DNA-binding protein